MGRGRLEAFSNGVIAVAITLLVLNLFLPGPGHGPLLDQLGQRWPSFVAYVIGFFVIGIIWVNHHALLRNIAVVDRTLLFPTLVFVSAGRSPQRLDAERGSAASASLNSSGFEQPTGRFELPTEGPVVAAIVTAPGPRSN